MTFSMSEAKCTKILVEDDGPEEVHKSARELEEEKNAEKEAQQKRDDIALLVCMIVIIALTVFVVLIKINFIDEVPNPNISTFRPLLQHVNSNKLYNGMGYMGCNGHVPCQPVYLSPENLKERMDGAMPCHNYKGEGDGPKGCW